MLGYTIINTANKTYTITIPGGGIKSVNLNLSVTNYNGAGGALVLAGHWYHHQVDSVMVVTELICDKVDDKYRFGYNGQEKVNEWAGIGNHNTALFWEYDTRIGRRINRDPVINYSVGPYSSFNDNPIQNSDHLGNTVDVTAAVGSDKVNQTNVTGNLTNELKEQTGLNISINDKNELTYQKDENGSPILRKDENGNVLGSSTARNMLIGAIEKTDVVSLSYSYSHGSKADGQVGQIALDPVQIMKFREGSKNVNNKTMGLGLTFLHELGHTKAGGLMADDKSNFGSIGAVEDKINTIRRELGPDYKQRLSYSAMTLGNGSSYIPFSVEAFNDLNSGNISSGASYIKFSESTNRKQTKEDVVKSIQYYKNIIKQ